MFSKKPPYSKFLPSRHHELHPKGKLRTSTSNHGFLASKFDQLSPFFLSCPLLSSARRRRAPLPLGAALHDLEEQVDGLEALVPGLPARHPHLPFPDLGQGEVRNHPFLRQHLL